MKTCNSCGNPIVWATTLNDKRIPMDARPDPKGLFLLRRDPAPPPRSSFHQNGPAWLAVPASSAEPPPREGEARYTSHFATCPNARQHRRSAPATRASARR